MQLGLEAYNAIRNSIHNVHHDLIRPVSRNAAYFRTRDFVGDVSSFKKGFMCPQLELLKPVESPGVKNDVKLFKHPRIAVERLGPPADGDL